MPITVIDIERIYSMNNNEWRNHGFCAETPGFILQLLPFNFKETVLQKCVPIKLPAIKIWFYKHMQSGSEFVVPPFKWYDFLKFLLKKQNVEQKLNSSRAHHSFSTHPVSQVPCLGTAFCHKLVVPLCEAHWDFTEAPQRNTCFLIFEWIIFTPWSFNWIKIYNLLDYIYISSGPFSSLVFCLFVYF